MRTVLRRARQRAAFLRERSRASIIGSAPIYGGPCPPIGRHRYFHKLYALDTMLPDLGHATKARLLDAMKVHVVAKAELVGTYQKGD
jgi:phosphatidylethanolamine-binding protein (PEBP) family uncharacterized protein